MKKNNCNYSPPEELGKNFIFLRVKLLALLCLGATLTASSTNLQSSGLDVSYDNVSLVSVLDDLKARTDYHFFYFEGTVSHNVTVSAHMKNASIDEILQNVLTKNGLTYRIENKVVSIGRAEPPRSVTQQQPVLVKGVVKDTDGEPVPWATVMIKGTSTGVAADANGKFSISLPDPSSEAVLIFSFVGMKSVEVAYTGQPMMKVTLEYDSVGIEDVVVTGVFNRPRESYTGAVTAISTKELETYRGPNLIQTLRNIDPSINILQNNLTGSNPNMMPDITIRGSSSLPIDVQQLNEGKKYNLNTPLIIMDGFEISLQKLMDYNDSEIQSINIFRDASATAIYGSRGANGVIVVVSKQPTSGKLRINTTINMDFDIPDLSSYNLLRSAEKLQMEWDNGFYDSKHPDSDRHLKEIYFRRYRDVIEGTDTYWLSKPLRTGVAQKYNVRIEGGSEMFRWSASTAYNHINGVMKNSSRDNFTGQIILQYQYKNIIFKNQTEIGNNKSVESNYGLFGNYAKMNPYYRPYDENGKLVKNFTDNNGNATIGNPLYDASLNSKNESDYTQIINNFFIEWGIVDGLTLRGKLGVSVQNSSKDVFIPSGHSQFISSGTLEKGSYTYQPGKSSSYDGSLNLGYSKVLNKKHSIYAGLDYSILQRKSSTYTIEGIGYVSDKLNSLGNALKYGNGRPQETEDFVRSVGFTGNVNYTYDNRYFTDASFRMDGSSQFGSKKRFAPFWSIGLGWNIHREKFFENSKIVNNLRLKLSYGETGSQQFSSYQAMRMFNYYTDNRYGIWTGAYLHGLGNENLKWQITDQLNIGTELGIFDNRITASLDYYIKSTSNLLSNIEIPLATGFDHYVSNVGEVKNTGFEAAFGGFIIRNLQRDISWMVNGRLAYNKNEITKLSEAVKQQTAEYLKANVDNSTLFYEGRSQNSIYVVRSLGIDPSTGQEIFLDKNENVVSEWKASDKVYAGVQEPTYRGNISTLFRYKNLSLNLSFAYHWGGVVYNSTLIDKVEMSRSSIFLQNVDRRALSDRWYKPGDIARFKKIAGAGENEIQTRGTTRFVMNDRVFQFQAASIEYNIDSGWLKKAGVQNARVGVTASDLFYISSVKRERGVSYPFARRMGAKLSLMF